MNSTIRKYLTLGQISVFKAGDFEGGSRFGVFDEAEAEFNLLPLYRKRAAGVPCGEMAH
ncbi:MAG: hypothetical protein ACJ73N_13495 [Bryobacteraceae bacterium]